MKKNNQRFISIAVAMLITLAGAGSLHALRAPHDSSKGINCGSCHKQGVKIRGFNPLCVSECHNTNGMAKRKALDLKFASNIFGTFTIQSPARQFSHAWSTQPNYSTAGKNNRKAGTNKTITLNQPSVKGVSGTSTIICPKCHYAHGTSDTEIAASGGTKNKPFIRVSTKGNFICFQCHEERQVGAGSARAPLAAGKAYSHPVEVNYSGIAGLKPDFFEHSPTNPYPTSAGLLPLYTTYGNVKGAVICSTCHGPLHSADSNPYTFDSMSAFSMGQYSASSADGRLLRRYGKSKDVNNDLCKSCHKVTTHRGFNCYRCHTPHKRQGENNRYLILENISTPYNGIRPVQFISTSLMAKRNGTLGGYSTAFSRLDKINRPVSNSICQVCHTGIDKNIKHHRNYSTVGADRDHNYLGGGNYKNCTKCHEHTGGFLPVGAAACGSCHNYPPTDTNGKHATHTNGSVGYTWGDGSLTDDRSATSYGFSCGRCHNPWSPYTASTNGKNHYGATPTSLKNYTADIGFGKGNHALPTNGASADYVYGARNGYDTGAASDNYQWSIPANGNGTCRNLYCHGQFFNGYTSNNPTWASGSQPCGSCHGAKRGDPPGKTNGVNWGAHPRHVGNANNQQYGSAGWKFGCSACHFPTVQASMTSVEDRSTHVDGKVNVEFNGGGYGNANSTYNGFADYTGRKPSMSKPAYKACGLIYCHSDGSRTQGNYSVPFNAGQGTGTGKFPNWSSSKNFTSFGGTTTKRRCARCHGSSYNGITAFMPGYDSRAGKGNSHKKHVIDNGFMCRVCHRLTIGADNKSIADTTKHVNKQYDVDILTSYSGVYDGATHTCSRVKCHGRQITPVWGNTAVCRNCHLTSAGDRDKRVLPGTSFQRWTGVAPKIYSSSWMNVGHGKSGIAKDCSDCHKATVSHGTANNPFRLFTAADRPNVICESCHGIGASNPGKGSKTGIQTHASSVTGGGHNYRVKCVDCHDPHGDNNIFMVHSSVRRPGSTNQASDLYGAALANLTVANVDFVNNVYTSDYARKFKAPKICQVCHNETYNPSDKTKSRFRWYSSSDKSHGSGKCTDCHQHTAGFKGAGCDHCHGFPPSGTFNILSGAGRTNEIKKRPSGDGAPSTESNTVGAHFKHYTTFKSSVSGPTICSFCHQGGMYGSGAENKNIDIGFRAFGDYSGSSQKYGGQSAVNTGYYGYSGIGINNDGTQKCASMKCHGGGNWLTASYGTISTPKWSDPKTGKCGRCHGVKKAAGQGSWPTSNAHARHAGTGNSPMQYDFMCKLCHNATVLGNATTLNKNVHVNGQANFLFYTGTGSGNRVYSQSNYTSGDTKVNSGFGWCKNTYCHSRGTTFTVPYNVAGSSLSNYTAVWNRTATATTGAGKECSFCHGSKVYSGITSAMPNYVGSPKINSHKKHVVDNGFSCYACHAATVNPDGRTISSKTNHVNKTYDVSFASAYSGIYNGDNTCSRVKCHGKRRTPAWGGTVGCTNCHFRAEGVGDADNMDYSFRNYSNLNSVPKIYSGEWMASGHGKSAGNYNRTNNPAAGKICTNCHVSSVKHNTGSNFFRLTGLGGGTDPSSLCKRCHGTGSSQLQASGFGTKTGIQSHTQQILSSSGYTNLTTWRFKPKCTDCHDPHGDAQASSGNIAMIRNTVLYNYSGSDSSGRPNNFPNLTTVFFEKYTGTRSFDDASGAAKGRLCAACHKRTAHNGTDGSGHSNAGKDCRTCHTHKKGFTPAGCTGCHGNSAILIDRANWAPPKAPTTTPAWSDSWTNMSSLHRPHAYNPRSRPGFGNQTGFACQYCHDDTLPSTANHNTLKAGANMTNLTSATGWNGRNSQAKFSYGANNRAPADDTCSNTTCHTPRAYQRNWKKPTDCNGCHGYRSKTAITGYNLHTTEVHKIHVGYTTAGIDKKKYGFACTRCHYDNANNYSTHYNGLVNFTTGGNFKDAGAPSTTGTYGRGKAFKGITTRNELTATSSACSQIYCHGKFTNGTTTDVPKWKKGLMTTTCTSCHKGKLTGGDGSLMPERHPKHVSTYSFPCVRCHTRTTNNITTVMFNWSSHVNGRKDTYFDAALNNNNGAFTASSRQCSNIYCHSSGYRASPGSFTTRTTLSNYTADWDHNGAAARTGAGRQCGYCHGNKTYAGITAAMPNQTSVWGNSHRRHVITGGFLCFVCHASTVNSAGAIASTANHVNGFKNISVIGAYKSGQTLYSTSATTTKSMTCKNIKCHGNIKTPKWGTYANCFNCHKSTAGDTDKRISSNGAFQGFSETAAKIYSSQWADRGHGRNSGSYTPGGNSGANKVCTDCHGSGEQRAGGLSTKHGTGSNPFRLITAPDRPNMVCNRCHGVGGSGATKNGILTHASSVTGQGHNFAIKCIDCHDPHGDNNAFMIHSTVARPRSTPARREVSNANGTLFASITGRNVDFTANNYSSDYAKKTTAAKICQVCHTQTYKPTTTSKTRFRWDGTQDLGHGTDKCTGCHSHSGGFKGVACDGCHGFPPTSKQNMLTSTTNGQKEPFSGTTSAGAHKKHVDKFGTNSNTCSYCHQGGMYGSGAKNTNIDIGFKAFATYTGNYGGKTGVKNGFYGYSGKGINYTGSARCSVSCHGGGGLLTASYGPVTAPIWISGTNNSAKCGKCHGAKKSAGSGSWPTTNAHAIHAGTGTGTGQLDFMCRLCHAGTVQSNNTGLNYPPHVNGLAEVSLDTADSKVGNLATYDGDTVVNSGFGKCKNTYCHSNGTDQVAPFNDGGLAYANMTARWTESRGSYMKSNGVKAKCNYCHGNSMSGITSAMPNYADGTPKANKHPKHVRTYNFLCNACHVDTAKNNTAISPTGTHVNMAYDINYTTVRTIVNNSAGSYVSGRCENLYCHSLGNVAASSLPNYTAKWAADMVTGGYKTGMKCKYCHGAKSIPFTGMTAAMPNYPSGSPKANAHNRHVAKYGFTCTVCHMKVTTNNTSIDAAGGTGLHVNKLYNVYFNPAVTGRPQVNNTGIYKYQSGSSGSSCKTTYCHSRGTDWIRPYSTRTSFSNFTAQWGDSLGTYKKAAGQKAKCNYCHGNRLFSGMTSAMPNYSTQIKPNTHKRHVVGYGFTCKACHKYVTNNNSSIDASGGIGRHVNGSYNVDFSNSFNNNTGDYSFIGVGSKNRCKNTYCHSRGTDLAKPFNTRTSFSTFTAMWGDTVSGLGYKTAKGAKAKCNYCHGNRAYTGTTSAMPNYSGTIGSGVTAKANSHQKHVIGNGYTCKVCHYGVVPNNTSISDSARHVNGFYNISIAPGYRSAGNYSTVYNTSTKTCRKVACHGSSKPTWGDPGTANCKACHLSSSQTDLDSYGKKNDGKTARLYSTEWGQKGHGAKGKDCLNCHRSQVAHGQENSNPFRLFTSDTIAVCLNCHGSAPYYGKWDSYTGGVVNKGYKTHSRANTGGNASWNNFSTPGYGRGVVKCVDCHDPHGDKNKKMIQSFINNTGSDRFGRPTRADFTTVSSIYSVQMTFTTPVGSNWSSFAWGNDVNKAICRRCHTPNPPDTSMGDKSNGLMTKTQYNGTHQSHQPCTNCHKHTEGFKGGGEPAGNDNCDGCHSELFNPMNGNTNGYHHVMINASGVYNNKTSFGSGDLFSKQRRCLMCHVRHKEFSPGVTPGRKRAANLRKSATATHDNQTGINTDFWPAKRTGKYLESSPVTPTGVGGVCISCHKGVQFKNTSVQADQTQRTPRIQINVYTSSSHNFQIRSSFNNFSGGSSFRANCLKCHGTYYMNKTDGAQGREEFGLHDTKYQSLNRPFGGNTSFKNPLSKQLCYRCHSNTLRSAGGPGGKYDYYSTVPMASEAKLIQTAVEAKTYGHPAGAFAGHRADELWSMSQGWMGNDGANKHVECMDCHNTHGGNASITRNVGGTDGNKAAGAQAGVWGVKPTSWPASGLDIASFAKVTSITLQYQLCSKCHTKFAWDTNTPPEFPSPGFTGYTQDDRMTDVMKEFNPNNPGYHPVAQRGRNQPARSQNANWPAANTTMKYYDPFQNKTGVMASVSGFDFTFIPPWNNDSTMGCTDCHQADSTGKAIAAAAYVSTVSNPGPNPWTGDANLGDTDLNYATNPSTSTAVLRVDVGGAPAFTGATKVELVFVGKAAVKNKTLTYNVYKSGSPIITNTATPAFLATVKTIAIDITAAMTTASCLDSICVNSNIEVDFKSTDGTVFNIDSVSVNSTFAMTEALRGPHGSMMQWILGSANTQIWVDWNNNGINDAGEMPNSTIAAGTAEERMFCFNCHRRDVYEIASGADTATNKYSRFKHWQVATGGGPAAWTAAAFDNRWGIPCMTCHGGARAGAIHGDWQGLTWVGNGTLGTIALTGARPAGVRLLNGAAAHLATITGATSTGAIGDLVCYHESAAGNGKLGGCTSSKAGVGLTAATAFNYSYTAY